MCTLEPFTVLLFTDQNIFNKKNHTLGYSGKESEM